MKATILVLTVCLTFTYSPAFASDSFFGDAVHSRFDENGLDPLAPYVIAPDGTVFFPDDEMSHPKFKPPSLESEYAALPRDTHGNIISPGIRTLTEMFRVKEGEELPPNPKKVPKKGRLGAAAYIIDFQIFPSHEKGSAFYLPLLDLDKNHYTGDIFDYIRPTDFSTILNRRAQFAIKDSSIKELYFGGNRNFVDGVDLHNDPVFQNFKDIRFPVQDFEIWLPEYGIKTVSGHVQVQMGTTGAHEVFFWLEVDLKKVSLQGLTGASKDYLQEALSEPLHIRGIRSLPLFVRGLHQARLAVQRGPQNHGRSCRAAGRSTNL